MHKSSDYQKIIQNNTNDHFIYFSTFTFKDTHQNQARIDYTNYFEHFMKRLSRKLVKAKFKKTLSLPKLIVFPEISKNAPAQHLYTPDHFHGHLLIPKTSCSKFKEKCLEMNPANHTNNFFYTDKNENERSYNKITRNILNQPFFDNLYIHEAQFTPVESTTDLLQTSCYATKRNLTHNYLSKDSAIIITNAY